jgi:hypothetical protein
MPLVGVLTANNIIANNFILQVKNTCKGKNIGIYNFFE